jgi:NOL1/NOP2/fmu family ribosome biogenesis protein
VDIKDKWEISPSFVPGIPAYRFFPHKTKGEGFFLAVLRKNDGYVDFRKYKKVKKAKDRKVKIDLPETYEDYIIDREAFTFYPEGETWFAFPKRLYDSLLLLKSRLNIISEGIRLGVFKGKNFVPAQSLALSNSLNVKAFEICNVDWKTAISYLRKEALALPNMPNGYILLIYNNIPVGFVKNIGNRANNLYPQEWRIRSANMPDREVKVIS